MANPKAPRTPMPQPFAPGSPVAVLSPEMPGRALDYLAPEGGCAAGDFVLVPLARRDRVPGVVWGPGSGAFPPERLRPISARLALPPMAPDLMAFLDRAAGYTLSPPGAMLRLATRVPGLGDAAPERRLLIAAVAHLPDGLSPARARVLAVLAHFGGAGLSAADLARAAGVGVGVVRTMLATGLLAEIRAPRDAPFARLDPAHAPPSLSPAQATAAQALRAGVASGDYATTLLKGVTGSGKTQVYLEAVAACLQQGRQALVMLPEIALTGDFLARVGARFGAAPGEWHSGLAPAERRRLWHAAARGEVGVVVGARSALMLPFRDLGLIVVDEEHDSSYKQEEGILYNARDMAVLRASMASAQVVLASATPSLETWVNARQGRYGRLDLPERFGAATLPEMRTIDMRMADLAHDRWISGELADAVQARLERAEQSLLFLNRRGYAPVTVCRACGHQIGCKDCDARMVEHRAPPRLVCHQCGATRAVPTVCPSCQAEGRLAALGPGVERLADEAARLWPAARIKVLASDQFASARALKDEIAAIAAGQADLIIGTQIVAKGHDFPLLTLVGVIDADLGLQGSDLRAAERAFQLIRQVAGRAGRREAPGQVLVQTHLPEHPVIRALLGGSDEAFWQAEAAARMSAGMPPFARLAAIILSGPDLRELDAFGQVLARAAAPLRAIGADLWGPAPAPIARIRARHRLRMLIRAPKGAPIQAAISDWLAPAKPPRGVRVAVDIDPQSFF
jgi:primosomal protein N' (replication factor Y)